MLKRCINKFRKADPKNREKIVNKAAESIKSLWTGNIEFDEDIVKNVRGLSIKLNYSQMFLAYS